MTIYSYLRLSDIARASSTCYYLYESVKSIWHDADFFKEVQTDKLNDGELRKILEKGGSLVHLRQLRSIYLGKNLKSCR